MAPKVLAVCFTSLALHGCWWDGSSGGTAAGTPAPATHTIGGTVTGLSTAGLVLSNGTETLTIAANSTSFTFATAVAEGASYSVAIATQPTGAQCTVTGGSGTVATSAVTSVAVSCTAVTHTVGGAVAGLAAAGLVLANGTDTLAVDAGATSFVFARGVNVGSNYAVTVQTQPTGETCAIGAGSGVMAGADVTSVTVTCTINAHHLGGLITGLHAAGLVLANGLDTTAPDATATTFALATVAEGATYAVTVRAQPTGETCTVTGGSGTMGNTDVNSIAVGCTTNAYRVGGSVTGLSAAGLVLANGSDTIALPVNATAFTLPTPVPAGASYSVTVRTQPTGLTCTVGGTFPATMGTADVTNVVVTCAGTTQFPLLAGRETCPASGGYQIDGTGAGASLSPVALGTVLDAAGNVWLADTYDIRRISPTGVVTTVAGAAFAGGNGPNTDLDGTGSAATFSNVGPLAADSAGNIYMLESDRIRRITPSGVVTTVPTGHPNNQFPVSGHTGIAIDASDNIYYTDASSIYKITPGGLESTFAGTGSTGYVNGPAGSAQFNWPAAMVFDTSGNMFVTDVLNNVIRKITPAGVVSTFVGTQSGGYKDGTGSAALFGQPYQILIDSSNNLYVPDNNNSVIRKVTPAGVVTSVAYAPFFQSQTGQVPPSGALILPVAGSNMVFSLTKNGVLNTPVQCAEEKITLP